MIVGFEGWAKNGLVVQGMKINDVDETFAGTVLGITSTIMLTALFISACVAASGVFSGTPFMWTALGLTIGFGACKLAGGGFANWSTWARLLKQITIIVLVAIALNTSLLNSVQLGYGIFSTQLITSVLETIGHIRDFLFHFPEQPAILPQERPRR